MEYFDELVLATDARFAGELERRETISPQKSHTMASALSLPTSIGVTKSRSRSASRTLSTNRPAALHR
jgi:hypothetical protein